MISRFPDEGEIVAIFGCQLLGGILVVTSPLDTALRVPAGSRISRRPNSSMSSAMPEITSLVAFSFCVGTDTATCDPMVVNRSRHSGMMDSPLSMAV